MKRVLPSLLAAILLLVLAEPAPAQNADAIIKGLKSESLAERQTAYQDAAKAGAAVVPDLIELLKEPEPDKFTKADADLRAAAGVAILRIGPAAMPELLKAMSAKDAGVRGAAVYLFEHMGKPDAEAKPRLEKEKAALDKVWMATNDAAEKARLNALRTTLAGDISKLADRIAKSDEARKNAIPELILLLKGPEPEIRVAAALALEKVGADAVAPLIELLREKDAYLRIAAASILGEIGEASKPALPDLVEALKDKNDASVRLAAAVAVARIGADVMEVSLLLFTGLSDAHRIDWTKCIGALGPKKGMVAVPLLTEVSQKDPIEKVREAAAAALQQIQGN